jgi:ubiquinone/menaquinone biosynthesis C-methylase UbiE
MTTPSYRMYNGTAAETYQRHFEPAIAIPVSAGLLAVAQLQPGERVLDVACGTGVIARRAAELVGATGTVTGVDLAPDMIDVAKATSGQAGAHIEWHVADAASLPLADAAYDVVLCQMGLMFMEDRRAALTEMRRVLTPGGRLVLNTPGRIQPAFEVMEEAIVEHISPELGGFVRAVFSIHDPDVLASLLRDAGFEEVRAEEYPATLRLPAPADFLWQYINLTPMGPFVAQAPEEAQAAMERRAIEGWHPYTADGRLRVDQPMVVASGRR